MKNLETVRTEVRENSLIIYLSREERMNAFTLTMQQEIVKVLDDAEEDDDIKAIIFTGDGKAYCAGADLSSGGDTFDSRKGRERTNDVVRDSGGLLTLRLFKCKKPLIAAVNGAAVGIGATMLLPMDTRIFLSCLTPFFIYFNEKLLSKYYLILINSILILISFIAILI